VWASVGARDKERQYAQENVEKFSADAGYASSTERDLHPLTLSLSVLVGCVTSNRVVKQLSGSA